MSKLRAEDLIRTPLHPNRFQSGNEPSESPSTEEELCEQDTSTDSIDSPSSSKSSKGKKSLYPNLDELNSGVNSSPESIANTSSRSDSVHSQKLETKETSSSSYFWYSIAFVVILGIVLGLYYYRELNKIPIEMSESLEEIMQDIKSANPRLIPLSYKILKIALKKVLNDSQPSSPAIIMLLASKGAEDINQNFSTRLYNVIVEKANIRNQLILDGKDLQKYSCAEAKKQIDEQIRQNFDENNMNILHFKNLDLVSGKAATMLHSYCDHENAPFKRSVIIMSVSSGETISPKSDSKGFDTNAKNRLRGVWSELDVDELNPLFARITESVVGIVPDLPSSEL